MNKYQSIASGTFDLLHKGHKSFLEKSIDVSSEVIVCITSDSYVESFKNGRDIEDFETRKKNVVEFLESIGARDRATIIPIDDVYGPLLTTEHDPQAIAVTADNEKNAVKINSERVKKGLPALEIIVIAIEPAEDGGVISSTRIRRGEINREGRLYVREEWLTRDLKLPESLRGQLQEPFGPVMSSVPLGLDPSKTVTIGDITSQKFNEKNVGQFLSIVDFQVQRQKKFDNLSDLGFEKEIKTVLVDNPPGSITPQLFEAVIKAFKSRGRQVILVNGEEDLAVLPVLLIAPLAYSVFYGQPSEGVVRVDVTEENKEKAYTLVNAFNY